jgi:hypothetical protein
MFILYTYKTQLCPDFGVLSETAPRPRPKASLLGKLAPVSLIHGQHMCLVDQANAERSPVANGYPDRKVRSHFWAILVIGGYRAASSGNVVMAAWDGALAQG